MIGFEKNRSRLERVAAMEGKMLLRNYSWLIAVGCGLLPMSCRSISNEWASRKDAVSAHNQMMLVRENPATLGYRRLMVKSEESADLKIFIDQTGLPDFLAEASSGDREYFFLYYLDLRQAFACRTASQTNSSVEFTGPYAMPPGELRLLKAAKEKASEVSVTG